MFINDLFNKKTVTESLRKVDTNFGSTVAHGSWVVYDGSKVKRFKSRDGAKAYAEKTGGKVASSEFYADNIQNKGMSEDAIDDRLTAQYSTPQAQAKNQALDKAFASGDQAEFDKLGVMSPQQIERDYQTMRAKEPAQDAAVMSNPKLTPGARPLPAPPKTNPKGIPIKEQGVAEGISVVNTDYDLDQMILTLDIEGTKKHFTYWDYDENFENAERKDVFDQLQDQPWYASLDHPTKMEILDAAYKAIRGEEPSEYRPTVGDEPLDEAGPFSYGAKKPRKGSVADLAAKKRKEQERGRQPIEPRDQMVGVAKVLTKGVAEDDDSPYMTPSAVPWQGGNLKQEPFTPPEGTTWRFGEKGRAMDDPIERQDSRHFGRFLSSVPNPIARTAGMLMRYAGQDPKEDWKTRFLKATNSGGTPDEIGRYLNKKPMKEASTLSPDQKTQLRKDISNFDHNNKEQMSAAISAEKKSQLRKAVTDYNKEQEVKKQGVEEGSVQDRLHRRHQELRKKSGLPNPDYYKELRATYDLPDEERYAKAAELKKKYNVKESIVTNEDRERYLDEIRRAGYDVVTEAATLCPECGGVAFEDRMLAEKQDACYHKVKSRYKVWPSAYASGALVRCRKKGAANWGNKSKK